MIVEQLLNLNKSTWKLAVQCKHIPCCEFSLAYLSSSKITAFTSNLRLPIGKAPCYARSIVAKNKQKILNWFVPLPEGE